MNNAALEKAPRKRSLPQRIHRWIQNEHAAGLTIHDGRITAAHFIQRANGLELDRMTSRITDPAISPRHLVQEIRSFWKANRIPTRTVCTCIHTHSQIVRAFSYTNLLRDELPRVLELEAEEALQLPLNEIALSWHINPTLPGKNEGLAGVLVAAPRKAVKKHIKLIKAAGLYPINVEISCSALINLYNYLAVEETATKPVCLIDLTAHTATIVILYAGGAYPRFVLSTNEEGWSNNIDYLASSIRNTLLNFGLKMSEETIDRLLIIGSPQQEHFIEKLSAAVDEPIETWNPFMNSPIQLSKPLQKILSPTEAKLMNSPAAVGLALRHPKLEL